MSTTHSNKINISNMSSTQKQVYKNYVDEENDDELLKGQAMVYNHLFAYTETLTLRSAIELRIADIIHSHGGPMSISQIASKIEAPSPHIGWLERVMRMLVRKQIFSINNDEGDNDEVLYGLTTTSKWLLHDQESSLAPMFLTLSDHTLVKPWFEISRSIKDGDESAFVKAHGESMWEMLAHNHEFKNMFNSGMANLNKPIFDAIFKFYKEGFSKLEGSIIDVGGASGKLVAAIVEAYPHIKGINFDLPHVVAKAPQYPGVVHVGGDMFQEVPCADNVIMKSILHNWTEESCLKALENCQKALSTKGKGRVIIVDIVLNPYGNTMFDNATIAIDLMMMINTSGGKERTEDDWKKLLKEAGFTHINFIPLQTIMSFSIIEAFV